MWVCVSTCICVCSSVSSCIYYILLDIACSEWLVTFWLLAGTSVWGARHNLTLPSPPVYTHTHTRNHHHLHTRASSYYIHTHVQTHTHTPVYCTCTYTYTHTYIIIIMYACTKVITRFSLLPNSPDTIILRFVFRISACLTRIVYTSAWSLQIPRVHYTQS